MIKNDPKNWLKKGIIFVYKKYTEKRIEKLTVSNCDFWWLKKWWKKLENLKNEETLK